MNHIARLIIMSWLSLCAAGCSLPLPTPVITKAAAAGNIDRVRAELRENPERVSQEGWEYGTPLTAAILNDHNDVVMLLLDHGADVNQATDRGTPLELADTRGNTVVVEELLRRQAVYYMPNDRRTPLITAVVRGNPHAVELMIRRRPADMAVTDYFAGTPLHWAAISTPLQYPEAPDAAIQLLLRYGAAVDATDGRNGRTPLHWAARSWKPKRVEALVAAGADVNRRDNGGKTPLGLIDQGPNPSRGARRDREEVRQFLRARGATL